MKTFQDQKSPNGSIFANQEYVPPMISVTAVTVSPSTILLVAETTQQFTAVVEGVNSPSQSVSWSKVGPGTLSSDGLYTAPAATNKIQNAVITATSIVNDSFSDTASVIVPAAIIPVVVPIVTNVIISPVSVIISNNEPVQFNASVFGTNNPSQEVTWQLTGTGTLSSTGLYIPPARGLTVQGAAIKATSVFNPSHSDIAVVTIPPAIIEVNPYITDISITPSTTITSGSNIQVTATVNGTTGYNPAVIYTLLSVNGSQGATLSLTGLFQGPISYDAREFDVVATSVHNPTWTATCRIKVEGFDIVPPYVPNSRMLVVSPKGKPHDPTLQNPDCAYTVRQGFVMIEKDPNARLSYGLDLGLYLTELGASLETATCTATGVKVISYEVSVVENKVLFWATAGDVEGIDNFCVIHFTCSDGSEDDRTIYFRVVEL